MTWQQRSPCSDGFRVLKIFRHIKVKWIKMPITSKHSVYAIFCLWVLLLAASCSKWTSVLGWLDKWRQTSTWGITAVWNLAAHSTQLKNRLGLLQWFPLSSARIRAEGRHVYFYASCFTWDVSAFSHLPAYLTINQVISYCRNTMYLFWDCGPAWKRK